MSYFKQIDLATNDLGRDAWGRPKVINDFSLFSALWTFDVPSKIWLHYEKTASTYYEQAIDSTYVKSEKGYLSVVGVSGVDTLLSSKRHPRYQPNKGLLYSTAVILPSPNLQSKRRWGLFNEDNGIFFEIVGSGSSWGLYIVRRSTLEGTLNEQRIDITSNLPVGFNISKGHVYDIQMEWRGVGNFYIYIDLALIYTFNLLGTLEEMSVSNPALNVSWEVCDVVNGTPNIIAGCVDVTSEGGHRSNRLRTSVNTGTALLSTTNIGVAIIAVQIPTTLIYNGDTVSYTRDMILTAMNTFCKDEYFTSLRMGRAINLPNLTGLTWSTAPDSLYLYTTNVGGALNTAYQLDKGNMMNVFSARNEKDIHFAKVNPDPETAEAYITPGDIIVIEIDSDGNSTGGCTLEFAEEV